MNKDTQTPRLPEVENPENDAEEIIAIYRTVILEEADEQINAANATPLANNVMRMIMDIKIQTVGFIIEQINTRKRIRLDAKIQNELDEIKK